MFFMPHVFYQSEHPFGQCAHISQVEPFEKPWYLVMNVKMNIYCVNICKQEHEKNMTRL
jgi:hypothetical protein